jgi:hypothetical protein
MINIYLVVDNETGGNSKKKKNQNHMMDLYFCNRCPGLQQHQGIRKEMKRLF